VALCSGEFAIHQSFTQTAVDQIIEQTVNCSTTSKSQQYVDGLLLHMNVHSIVINVWTMQILQLANCQQRIISLVERSIYGYENYERDWTSWYNSFTDNVNDIIIFHQPQYH